MKTKTRIKEVEYMDGHVEFFPQWRILFLWCHIKRNKKVDPSYSKIIAEERIAKFLKDVNFYWEKSVKYHN